MGEAAFGSGPTRVSTLRVDNSAPTLAVSAPSPLTGSQYQSYDAATKTLWLNAARSGSFKLEAAASDPDSGIGSVTFPALLGTGANGSFRIVADYDRRVRLLDPVAQRFLRCELRRCRDIELKLETLGRLRP